MRTCIYIYTHDIYIYIYICTHSYLGPLAGSAVQDAAAAWATASARPDVISLGTLNPKKVFPLNTATVRGPCRGLYCISSHYRMYRRPIGTPCWGRPCGPCGWMADYDRAGLGSRYPNMEAIGPKQPAYNSVRDVVPSWFCTWTLKVSVMWKDTLLIVFALGPFEG